ncbi:MAG: ABC transporter permease subunit [Deltaproteobacteria bacterium]|nr:ABC transporter permease subunit [Deltaproteobacteria bacterium]
MKTLLILFMLLPSLLDANDVIRIGSKKFTEGYLLSEITAQLIEAKTNLKVERKFGLGGTVVCFEALKNGSIDLYPEYTGTAIEVLLHGQGILDFQGLKKIFLKEFRLEWLEPFGFNNTYALAVSKGQVPETVSRISDLRPHPEYRYGLSHEFLERGDGWPSLSQAYFLTPKEVRGLDHGLAYESIAAGKVDVIDAYSTDAKIRKFDLRLLEDDRQFFQKYLAAPLVRNDFLLHHPEVRDVLNLVAGKISEEKMQHLNAAVELDGKSFSEATTSFLVEEGLIPKQQTVVSRGIGQLIFEHLLLTFVSVGLATLIGLPAGILVSRRKKLAQVVLSIAGVAQTIPGIALLVFMIPILGIGTVPAITALFIYGLLPIVRNSCVGIREISPLILESADGLGLTKWQRLRYVEIPMAARFIMAGIRISTVTNIGTATLAAFIGAGGLGEPIVTGLALNDMRIVFRGAIPAALLAILAEIFFETLEKWITPRGLRVL